MEKRLAGITLALSLILVLADQIFSHLLMQSYPGLVVRQPFTEDWQPFSWVGAALTFVALYRYALRNRRLLLPIIPLGLGFLSNLLSMLLFGSYVDYIPTGISYTNLADMLIVGGGVWLISRLFQVPAR